MNAPEKITAAEPMNAAHEILMKAASGMCSQEIAAAITGTPRPTKPQIKAAEKMLKAIHDCGMLASQPGRGGVALYSLTTPVCNINEMGDVSLANEGKTAGVCDLAQTGSGSQAVAETTERQLTKEAEAEREDFRAEYGSDGNCSCHLGSPCNSCIHPGNPLQQDENPDCWETVSIVEPQTEDSTISDEVRAQMQSLNAGVQWLGPEDYEMPPADPALLASANRMLSERLEGVAHALRGCGLPALAEVTGHEDLQMATAALSGAYQMALADRGDLVTELRTISDELRALDMLTNTQHAELLEQSRQIISLTTDVTDTRRALSDARNEADRMRSELAIERQARKTLQEQINAAPAPAHKGYVLKTPKRAMRSFGKESAAQSAAMAAARAGKVSEVFALVPVGKAVRGAEWKVAS